MGVREEQKRNGELSQGNHSANKKKRHGNQRINRRCCCLSTAEETRKAEGEREKRDLTSRANLLLQLPSPSSTSLVFFAFQKRPSPDLIIWKNSNPFFYFYLIFIIFVPGESSSTGSDDDDDVGNYFFKKGGALVL